MISQPHPRLRLAAALMLLLGSGLLVDFSAAGQSYCDPSLPQPTAGQLGYRDRGDRCEGLYIEKVGGTPLMVASLTESFEKYDARSGKALHVEWDRPPGNSAVRLRAQGLNPRLYYRMDTAQPPGSTSYVWPSNVLASLNIRESDIGVLGFTRYAVGTTEQDIYVPLRISQVGKALRTRTFTLTLLPGVELQELFVTLAATGADGRPRGFIKDREKLGYGFYPADRRIEVPIPGLKTSGTYYVQVGATLKGGGSATVEFWFYYTNR